MSGTTIRTESNVVSMLDRMMQVESGSPQVGTRPPESGTIVFQDGRQRVFEQAKGDETLGPILDLIRARTSHEVAEGIIRNMGVHAGKPVSRDMPVSHELVVRLHQATVAAFEQRNLEVIERYLGGDPKRTMLVELARLDPRLGAELENYGTEIDVFVEVFRHELEEEARRSARRGEEMREDQARAVAERILQEQRFRRAPLRSPQHLARAVQSWGQQKGRQPLQETVQKIEVEVRDGGATFARVSEMVRRTLDSQPLEPPYTSETIARHMLDGLETLHHGKKG